MKVIKLHSVDSTNSYVSDILKNADIKEDTVYYTDIQTRGRGLNLNIWESEDYKNLIFSIYTNPKIEIDDYFVLSMLVSLGICDYLHFKGVFVQIKWPNDIYYKNNKLAGILIENSLMNDCIVESIIGVGLNLNQTEFSDKLLNPISLANITGKKYDIENEISIISNNILKRIKTYKSVDYKQIKTEYLDKLFRFDLLSTYRIKGNVITAKIIDVKPDGYLVVKTNKNDIKEFYFKEIEYVI